MNTKTPSVSQFVLVNFSILLVVILFFYSYSVNLTYNWGSDDTFHYFLTLKAEELSKGNTELSNIQETSDDYIVYQSYSSLPEKLKQKYQAIELNDGDLLFYQSSNAFHYFLVYSITSPEEYLIIEHPYYFLEDDYNLGISIENFILLLIFLSIIIGALFYFRVVHRLTSQIKLLASWCVQKQQQFPIAFKEPFNIREIKNIAKDISSAVDKLQEKTIREKNFLKSLSHEIRTPLAITKASLELLEKQNNNFSENTLKKLTKIKNSNIKMSQLSDSLLHLWSEKPTNSTQEKVNIEPIIESTIKANKHLIQNKKINLYTDISENEIKAPQELLKILVHNLIRNAFQYTAQGIISIQYSSNTLTVENPPSDDIQKTKANDFQAYGFGVGLFVVESICEKLNWRININSSEKSFIVTISITS